MSYTGTGARIGVGSTLGHSTTSGGTYTNLGELLKINFPKIAVGDIKATNMQTTGTIHEYIPGFSEGGEVDFESNFIDAEMVILQANVRVALFWKLTLPNGALFAFPGYLKEVDGETTPDNKMITKGKIKVSGAVTYTVGS